MILSEKPWSTSYGLHPKWNGDCYMINGRVNQSGFMNAILEGKGISLDSEDAGNGRGREASYRATVQKNGNILIGSTYTTKMGLQMGDEFEIKVGRKQIQLKLVSAES